MAKKTLDSIPVVPVGKSNCLACRRHNLAGGDNSCPLKEVREVYVARGTTDCAAFLPLTRLLANARLGWSGRRDDRGRKQEPLF